VVAPPVGLVSTRRSAHPPRTSSAPTAHLYSPLLTVAHPLRQHCAPLPSGAPVLVTLSASCPLELVNFRRRTPAGWRGARAGPLGCKTGSTDAAMPSPPTVAYKAWSTALALSVSSSIPAYLVPVALPIDSQCAFVASSKTELHSTFVSLSSCSSISLLPTRFTAPELLSVPPAMPKKKSPEDFFQRAREKGSGINKAIVNGAEVQKHLQPKTAKNYARALDLWNG